MQVELPAGILPRGELVMGMELHSNSLPLFFGRGVDVTLDVADQLVPLREVLVPVGVAVDVGQVPTPPVAVLELLRWDDLAEAAPDEQGEILRLLPAEVAQTLDEAPQISAAKHALQTEELELSIPSFGTSGRLAVLLGTPAQVVADLLLGEHDVGHLTHDVLGLFPEVPGFVQGLVGRSGDDALHLSDWIDSVHSSSLQER